MSTCSPSLRPTLPSSLSYAGPIAASSVLWLFRRLLDCVAPALSGSPSPGIDVRAFSPAGLEALFEGGVPVHLRPAASSRSSETESFDALRVQSEPTHVSPRSHLRPDHRPPNRSLRLGTFVDRALSERIYPYQACFGAPVPTDLPGAVGGRPRLAESSAMFVGGRGHVTLLHYDVWHGLLFQRAGRKRVLIFPPEDARHLNARSHLGLRLRRTATALPGPVAELAPESFPALRRTACREVVLSNGDALYIPPFWWHEVSCETPSISMAVRYLPNRRELCHSSLFPIAVHQARWTLRQRLTALAKGRT